MNISVDDVKNAYLNTDEGANIVTREGINKDETTAWIMRRLLVDDHCT